MKWNRFSIIIVFTLTCLLYLMPANQVHSHPLGITMTPTKGKPTDVPTKPPSPTDTPVPPSPAPTDSHKVKPPLVTTPTALFQEASQAPVITKSSSRDMVSVGDSLDFTIMVHNPTGHTLTNVKITDKLPQEVDFVSAAADTGTYYFESDSHSITFEIERLDPGQTVTLVIHCTVNDKGAPPSEFSNSAVLSTNELGIIESNQITISYMPAGVPVTGSGGRFYYQITQIFFVVLIFSFLVVIFKKKSRSEI